MSYLENKDFYIKLCNEFLDDKIQSNEFEQRYFEQWRIDRNLEEQYNYQQSQQSDWNKKFREIVSKIFTGLDCCSHDNEPDREMGEITPGELKKEIKGHFKELENFNKK